MCSEYSNKSCIIFFAVWNIVWGIIWTAFCVFFALVYLINADAFVPAIRIYLGAVCAPLYLISGILIIVGDQMDKPLVFKWGLYLSNPLPIVYCTTLFLPIVHFIAVARLCRHSHERWPK